MIVASVEEHCGAEAEKLRGWAKLKLAALRFFETLLLDFRL